MAPLAGLGLLARRVVSEQADLVGRKDLLGQMVLQGQEVHQALPDLLGRRQPRGREAPRVHMVPLGLRVFMGQRATKVPWDLLAQRALRERLAPRDHTALLGQQDPLGHGVRRGQLVHQGQAEPWESLAPPAQPAPGALLVPPGQAVQLVPWALLVRLGPRVHMGA